MCTIPVWPPSKTDERAKFGDPCHLSLVNTSNLKLHKQKIPPPRLPDSKIISRGSAAAAHINEHPFSRLGIVQLTAGLALGIFL